MMTRETGLIRIRVGSAEFEGMGLPDIYKQVLAFLVETHRVDNLKLPIATSGVRYILAKEPVHQRGNSFVAPCDYKGYYLETHKEREGGLEQLEKYVLSPCGLKLEIIES